MATIPEGLRIEDREPRKGEAGWWVYEDETPQQWLEDVVRGVDPDSDAPGGYGSMIIDKEIAYIARYGRRRRAHDRRWIRVVTVFYHPPLSTEASEALDHAFEAAERYGSESDFEHEVGDLQQLAIIFARHLGSEGTLRALAEYAEFRASEDEDVLP